MKDEKKAITAVVNQVDKLKRLYDKAEAIRNATGAGNTDEATLEQQVLKVCPVYDSLHFLKTTYGPESNVHASASDIPAETAQVSEAECSDTSSSQDEGPVMPPAEVEIEDALNDSSTSRKQSSKRAVKARSKTNPLASVMAIQSDTRLELEKLRNDRFEREMELKATLAKTSAENDARGCEVEATKVDIEPKKAETERRRGLLRDFTPF